MQKSNSAISFPLCIDLTHKWYLYHIPHTAQSRRCLSIAATYGIPLPVWSWS